MLSNMEDQKSIGPAMAVALLTTLYGAMLATMIANPIADKMDLRMTEEARMQARACWQASMRTRSCENDSLVESSVNMDVQDYMS